MCLYHLGPLYPSANGLLAGGVHADRMAGAQKSLGPVRVGVAPRDLDAGCFPPHHIAAPLEGIPLPSRRRSNRELRSRHGQETTPTRSRNRPQLERSSTHCHVGFFIEWKSRVLQGGSPANQRILSCSALSASNIKVCMVHGSDAGLRSCALVRQRWASACGYRNTYHGCRVATLHFARAAEHLGMLGFARVPHEPPLRNSGTGLICAWQHQSDVEYSAPLPSGKGRNASEACESSTRRAGCRDPLKAQCRSTSTPSSASGRHRQH